MCDLDQLFLPSIPIEGLGTEFEGFVLIPIKGVVLKRREEGGRRGEGRRRGGG